MPASPPFPPLIVPVAWLSSDPIVAPWPFETPAPPTPPTAVPLPPAPPLIAPLLVRVLIVPPFGTPAPPAPPAPPEKPEPPLPPMIVSVAWLSSNPIVAPYPFDTP